MRLAATALLFAGAGPFAAEPGYIDSIRCRACHAEIHDAFARTGMGRSFQPASSFPLAASAEVRHAASRSAFHIATSGANTRMRHAETKLEVRVEWLVGSGNHSRTPLFAKANGRLGELPVSFYSERGGYWAMSPGYDRPDHSGFRREVSDGCMFCHNAYPSAANGGIGKGIDCQRCHGPGEAHASSQGRIVNPAKLARERALEVCLQCHLETGSRSSPDAIRRYDRGAFSYRPGEPLAAFQLYFEPAGGLADDAITVNSAGGGLLRSRCHQASGGAISCTTCHDPHGAKKVDANAACGGCHAAAHPGEQRGGTCTGCHMPKRRTEDAVHVIMTDHRIARHPPRGNPLAERPERHERHAGPVKYFYPSAPGNEPESRAYFAVAQRDTRALEEALKASPSLPAGLWFELGRLEQGEGRRDRALAHFRMALRRDSSHVASRVAAAELLLRSGNTREAVDMFEGVALEHTDLLNTLGAAYVASGRYKDAASLLRRAIALDEWTPMSHVNLGVALQAQGDRAGAVASYERALVLEPGLAKARQLLDALRR